MGALRSPDLACTEALGPTGSQVLYRLWQVLLGMQWVTCLSLGVSSVSSSHAPCGRAAWKVEKD